MNKSDYESRLLVV